MASPAKGEAVNDDSDHKYLTVVLCRYELFTEQQIPEIVSDKASHESQQQRSIEPLQRTGRTGIGFTAIACQLLVTAAGHT